MAEFIRYLPAGGRAPIDFMNAAGVDGIRMQHGAKGLLAPPVLYELTEQLGQDGATLDGAKYGAREPMLPIMLRARDSYEFRTRLTELVRAAHVHDGLGELEVDTDGIVRRLRCMIVGGLEGDRDTEVGGGVSNWWRAALKFVAPDPYWYDATPVTSEWGNPDPRAWFPIFPLQLSSSQTIGETTARNEGDANTYPVWTLVGPFTDATLRNNSTGEWLKVTSPLAAGRTLVINTRPGETDVTSTGPIENWWSKLDPASTLWPLPPGDTNVSLLLTGANSATKVRVEYRRRWLSP